MSALDEALCWNCTICTFRNPLDAGKCAMCNNARPQDQYLSLIEIREEARRQKRLYFEQLNANNFSYFKDFNIMSHRKELIEIVCGYIRTIQALLSKPKIIPQSIFELCQLFYGEIVNILWIRQRYDDNNPVIVDFGKFNVANKKSKGNISINDKLKFFNQEDRNFLCHISNISLSNKRLNGIFVGLYGSDQTYPQQWGAPAEYEWCPGLILYRENNKGILSQFKSNKIIKGWPRQFIYGLNQNNIIYEFNGKIYELRLDDIKSNDDMSNFKEIAQKNPEFWSNERLNMTNVVEYFLNMTYLQNIESLFAISCRGDGKMYHKLGGHHITGLSADLSKKCGIFNMKTNKWNDIKPYEYLAHHDNFNVSSSCYNGVESVYLSAEDTRKYDINKNEWTKLCDKPIAGKLWFDDVPNILYGLSHSILSHIDNSLSSRFKISSLDLRDNKKRIKDDYIIFDKYPVNQKFNVKIFK